MARVAAKDTKPPKKKQRRNSPPSSSDDDGSPSPSLADDDDRASSAHQDDNGVSDEDEKPKKGKAAPKQKSAKGEQKAKKAKAAPPPKKSKGKKRKQDSDDDDGDFEEGSASEKSLDEDEDSDGGLNTRVVKDLKKKAKAPEGNAETHVILPTTLDFLRRLAKNNDREWFQHHDAQYRHANLNFTRFVTAWIPKATEADWSLPHLPAKDVMQRIYRDVRFSKDKTPYKKGFSASTSRTGRKGPYGIYYIHIQPNDQSHLGCGCWGPATSELKLFRSAILQDPKPLRKILKEPEFVKLFGEPKPRMDGKHSSIFGWDDQLKNAPKLEGVDKTHKDIDLLKCRSFAVSTKFTDKQITSDDFIDIVCKAMETASPFIHWLNDIISPPEDSDDGGGQNGGGSDDEGGEDSEEDDKEEEE
ncbi:hypothetical protein JCM8547_002417 [Rhodosporidiobolus lusitaniae]